MKRLWYYFIYLFLVWGSFRYWVRLPEVIEELWFKPVIWLVPLFWWNLALKERVFVLGGKWLRSVCFGLITGLVYFVLLRRFDFVALVWNLDVVGVVIATAVTEELVFSGFMMGYMEKLRRARWLNLITVSLMIMMVRMPILIFVYKLGLVELLGALLLSGAVGAINAWLRVETDNVSGSIIARMGMSLAVLR